MTTAIEPRDFERFQDLVAARLGLSFDQSRRDELAAALRGRMRALGCASASSYVKHLSSAEACDELRVLADLLTIPETYFFRHPNNFRALVETMLPERIRAQAAQRRLRILSAGCSTGDEPYTIAILLREHFPNLVSWQVAIRGITVSPASVKKARQAQYSAWSLRETPEHVRRRYFRQDWDSIWLKGISFSLRFSACTGTRISKEPGLDLRPCGESSSATAGGSGPRRPLARGQRSFSPSGRAGDAAIASGEPRGRRDG